MKDVIFGKSEMQSLSLEEEKFLRSYTKKAINDRDSFYSPKVRAEECQDHHMGIEVWN